MKLKTLKQVSLKSKTVLYRSPYDIGVQKVKNGWKIKDNLRLKATLPTLRYLIKQNCRVVILTWVGRPDGRVVEELRTTPHARALSALLGQKVKKIDDCQGPEAVKAVKELHKGELLMLENTRFYPEEMVDDDRFARRLAELGDLIVFDAFPQAHRFHASTTGILRHRPACAGLYLEKEVKALSALKSRPQKPFVLVIGGAKVSDKVEALANLLPLTDQVLLGGGVANLFLKACGYRVGDSFVEAIRVDQARGQKKNWQQTVGKLLSDKTASCPLKQAQGLIKLPLDVKLTDSLAKPRHFKTVKVATRPSLVPDGWAIGDLGPVTTDYYQDLLRQAKTVFWCGPLGLYEQPGLAEATKTMVRSMAKLRATTVISGGDTVPAAQRFVDLDDFSHVSLAGGATLLFLAGKKLPALELLKTS